MSDGFPLEPCRVQDISVLWSLREDVSVGAVPGGVELSGRWGDLRIGGAGPELYEALQRMTLGPVRLDNVAADAATVDAFMKVLNRLQGLVVRSLADADCGRLLISVVPLTRAARLDPDPEPAPEDRPVKLSRFTVARTEGDHVVLESPLSLHRVVLCAPEVLSVLGGLARPAYAGQTGTDLPVSDNVIREVLGYLIGTGMVLVADSARAGFAEDTDPVLGTWTVPDLLFHTRSVTGRDDGDFGAAFPLAGRIGPPPPVKERPAGRTIPLPRPSLAGLRAGDPAFTTVLEGRRSVRDYGPGTLTRQALGEFLYRTARVRSLREVGTGPARHTVSDRPYPSGGATYDLELYLTLHGCEDVPDGIHHYAPDEHCLILINDDPAAVGELLAGAVDGAALSGPPSALITLTSRFQRIGWKYRGLAYALALKNAGALLQTCYLVATAMGLAGCATCTEDSELCGAAFGLDWRAEPPVGSFALGPLPTPDAEARGGDRRAVNDPEWREDSIRALRRRG